jgi:hypothetical protein
MSIGSIGSGGAASWTPTAGGAPVDPRVQRAQVNAQADTLQALMGTRHTTIVAARVADGQGIDLFM